MLSNASVLLWDNASRIPPQGLDSGIQFHQSQENIGFARACNQLALMTEADILLFFNPDARASPEVLLELAQRAWEKQALLAPLLQDPVQGDYRSWAPFPQRNWYGLAVLWESLRPRHRPFRVDWVMGACFAIPRHVFLQAGGFWEDYFVFTEDLDLCWRLYEKGIFTWLEPDLRMEHPRWGWSGARMELISQNLSRYAEGKSLKSYLRWHRFLKNLGRMSPEDFLMMEKALCPEKHSD